MGRGGAKRGGGRGRGRGLLPRFTWKMAILKHIRCSMSVKVRWRSKCQTSGGVVAKTSTLPMMVGTSSTSAKPTETSSSRMAETRTSSLARPSIATMMERSEKSSS